MKKRTIVLIIFSSVGLVLLSLFLGWKMMRPFRVPTGSMAPTIPAGGFVWVNELAYFSPNQIERGDVVTFDIVSKHPNQPGASSVYVFRVMAIPGDAFDVDSMGKVIVNGEPLKERQRGEAHCEFQSLWYKIIPMVKPIPSLGSRFGSEGISNGIVPEGKFFVMGDHRGSAFDSRYWGYVPWEDIRGKVRGLDE